MTSFLKACLELPVYGSLCNQAAGLTAHRFEGEFWLLHNAPGTATDLGRILTDGQIEQLASGGVSDSGLGHRINIPLLKLRKEWFT